MSLKLSREYRAELCWLEMKLTRRRTAMRGPSGFWETQSQKALIRLTSSLSLQGFVHWKNNLSNFFLEEFRCCSSINLKRDFVYS